MGGTVGCMFVLSRLVPLVGGDPVVHEPGRRGTFLGAGRGGLKTWTLGREERDPTPLDPSPISLPPPLSLSITFFRTRQSFLPDPRCTSPNTGCRTLFIPYFIFFTGPGMQYRSPGHSCTDFHICTLGPGGATPHPSALPWGNLPPRKPAPHPVIMDQRLSNFLSVGTKTPKNGPPRSQLLL